MPRGCAIQLRVNMERMQPDGSALPAGGTITATRQGDRILLTDKQGTKATVNGQEQVLGERHAPLGVLGAPPPVAGGHRRQGFGLGSWHGRGLCCLP